MSDIPAATLDNILTLAQQAAASGSGWVSVYGAIIAALSTTYADPEHG